MACATDYLSVRYSFLVPVPVPFPFPFPVPVMSFRSKLGRVPYFGTYRHLSRLSNERTNENAPLTKGPIQAMHGDLFYTFVRVVTYTL